MAEIREIQPHYSRPQRIRHKWTSPSSGHEFFGPRDFEELELETLKQLDQEILAEVSETKALMKAAAQRNIARGLPKEAIAAEMQRLRRRRGFLVGLHNAAIASLRETKARQRQDEHNTWSVQFVEACKALLPREQYLQLAAAASERLRNVA